MEPVATAASFPRPPVRPVPPPGKRSPEPPVQQGPWQDLQPPGAQQHWRPEPGNQGQPPQGHAFLDLTGEDDFQQRAGGGF